MTRKSLRRLSDEISELRRKRDAAACERLVPGRIVHVITGDRETPVRVVRPMGDSLWVANDDRCTEYVVSIHRLTEVESGTL